MKRVISLAAITLLAGNGVYAQSNAAHCGYDIVKAALAAQDPAAAERHAATRAAMISEANGEDAAAFKTTANGPIPVVFHIVLNPAQLTQIGGTAGVIERVDSSIAVLNRDYNRRNADSTRIPAVFKPLYTNVDIQFAIALRDPQGQATPGYEIYTTTASGFPVVGGSVGSTFACSDAKYTTAQGGSGLAAWDPSKYLNVWVCNPTPNGILGVAVSPTFSTQFGIPAGERGVVLNYRAFGKRRQGGSTSFISGIDSGRTFTHEAGHFFELEHIWGGSDPENCTDDDGIGDTPQQLDENYQCPTGVLPNCTGSAGGEMYMNYMDYCDDRCLVMFTTQQGNVMRGQVQSGPSVSLTQNPQLTWPLSVAERSEERFGLALSPNPAHGATTVSFTPSQKLQSAIVMDAMGRAVRTFAGQGAVAGVLSLDLAGLAPGMYTLRAQFEDGAATRKLVIQ